MNTANNVMLGMIRSLKIGIKVTLVIVALAGFSACDSSVAADTPNLRAVPSDRVAVSGVRGVKPARNLVLRSDSKLNNLKIIPTDLIRKDGQEAFSAQWVLPSISALGEVKPGEPVTIPISFDLQHSRVSGDFSGILLVQYQGGEITIPVQVQIKDDAWLPIVCLVVGVGVALLLAWYQSEGMDRDEVLQQMGRVKLQLQADVDVPESFRASVQRGLIGIETALEERRWDSARQQASQVQVIWDRWRQWRSDWLRQIDYKKEQLDKSLEVSISATTVYGQALQSSLERITSGQSGLK
jgi:hypothetical protein